MRVVGLIAVIVVLAGAAASPAVALDNGLARTPYMGWNTYYGLGGDYDGQTIRARADAIVDRGLKAAGYEYVWIDGGWWSGTRDADGDIVVDPRQWPNGMKAVADYIHSKGLKAGIYTDAGRNGCGGANQGSYGRYQQDADQFAAWGFDAVKVDFCGGTEMHLDPEQAYREFSAALLNNASDRPLLLNICNFVRPGAWGGDYPPLERSVFWSWTFGPETGNSWRTDTDVGFVRNILFRDVLRNIDTNDLHPEVAGPGAWNDPDYLGPELGMTAAQSRAQFTLWSLSAAPLIIGSDVRSLSDESIAMLTDREVIAVNQDRLGIQGRSIARDGDAQVWAKPLTGGDRAVALLNRGDRPLTVETTAEAVGIRRAARYRLRDLWSKRERSSAGRIAATVPGGSVVLLQVSVERGRDLPPATTLTSPALSTSGPLDVVAPGRPATVEATFRNDGREPFKRVELRLRAPAGWTVAPERVEATTLHRDELLQARWTVTPAAGALPGRVGLKAEAGYGLVGGGSGSESSDATVIVPEEPPAGRAFLSDHGWLAATSGWQIPLRDASVGGNPITLRGRGYAKGIGVASPSHVDFYLGGNCTRLTATVGIDDAVDAVGPEGGTATFAVLGDGRTLAETGVVDRFAPRELAVDVRGVEQLRLAVGDAGDGGYNDRADWAGLEIDCGGAPAGAWPVFARPVGAGASSAHDGYGPQAAIDGRLTTLWHSEFTPPAPLPQSITLDLGAVRDVSGLTYQPRLDTSATGTITGYSVAVSVDGAAFEQVAGGSWGDDRDLKSVTLPTIHRARYMRLTAERAVAGYASAAEVRVAAD